MGRGKLIAAQPAAAFLSSEITSLFPSSTKFLTRKMAEAFISVLLERLALVTYHHVEEEVKLVLNGEKGIAKFMSNLEIVGAVVEDAEKRQVKEAELRDRLDKLKVDLTPVRGTNSILINMQFSEIGADSHNKDTKAIPEIPKRDKVVARMY